MMKMNKKMQKTKRSQLKIKVKKVVKKKNNLKNKT